MTKQHPPRRRARIACWLAVCASALSLVPSAAAQTLPAGSPVLLTEGTGTTTRAVAHDSVTFRSEPFPVVSPYNWNADKSNTRDQQTRVTLFAMNLALLPGEGANALTADAQDAAGNVYPLRVESLTTPRYVRLLPSPGNPNQLVPTEVAQGWLYAVVLRLNDQMTDSLGDVLVRINLHGMSSNRVRVAVGQNGAGPPADPSTEFASPAPAAEPPATPTPTPKQYGPGEASTADVTRLLEQATWGQTSAEVERVRQMGIRAFLDEQFNAPVLNAAKGSDFPDLAPVPDDASQQCPNGSPDQAACLRDNYTVYPVQKQFFLNALQRPTQLRQRVAFALHQVFVVSGRDLPVPSWMTPYVQSLDRNAFGNFRTLLGEVTLNPAMGEYLNMNQSTASNANENFAREILQLFSIGVNQLNADGTPVLDSQGLPVPSYSQNTVNEFTRVFTGWNFNRAPSTPLPQGTTNFRDPMVPRNGTTHDTGAKTLFSTTLPGCPGASGAANGACAQGELNAALDVIFNHPNVGPFISKQLIQHLVTSNPSPAYVQRAAAAFNSDCAGLYPEAGCANARGNLKAVVRAILLDPEARGDVKTDPNYGKLREPVQYVNNILRAFGASSDGVLNAVVAQLDQPVYQPTTVFSYYTPDYEVPGTKILGPAFQILSTSTTLRRANMANLIVYNGVPAGTNSPTGTQLNLAPLDALSTADATGGQLVDHLNALLLHGTMSQAARTAIMTAVQSVPASSPRQRVQAAVYLVVTSPQFDVQR